MAGGVEGDRAQHRAGRHHGEPGHRRRSGNALRAYIRNRRQELAIEPITATTHDGGEIADAMAALARKPDSGLIVAPDTFSNAHRELIVALAARHRVPAIYGQRQFPASGGLLSYGPDLVDTVGRAASYVDRILRGAKPAELPVQAPTKFEMVVNLKAAKALDLAIPESFLLRADQVIE
jgi:ABC-type uncharacterized transport system substrate-binding protein